MGILSTSRKPSHNLGNHGYLEDVWHLNLAVQAEDSYQKVQGEYQFQDWIPQE